MTGRAQHSPSSNQVYDELGDRMLCAAQGRHWQTTVVGLDPWEVAFVQVTLDNPSPRPSMPTMPACEITPRRHKTGYCVHCNKGGDDMSARQWGGDLWEVAFVQVTLDNPSPFRVTLGRAQLSQLVTMSRVQVQVLSFLAMLVPLHFIPVSWSVGRSFKLALRLASLFLMSHVFCFHLCRKENCKNSGA